MSDYISQTIGVSSCQGGGPFHANMSVCQPGYPCSLAGPPWEQAAPGTAARQCGLPGGGGVAQGSVSPAGPLPPHNNDQCSLGAGETNRGGQFRGAIASGQRSSADQVTAIFLDRGGQDALRGQRAPRGFHERAQRRLPAVGTAVGRQCLAATKRLEGHRGRAGAAGGG